MAIVHWMFMELWEQMKGTWQKHGALHSIFMARMPKKGQVIEQFTIDAMALLLIFSWMIHLYQNGEFPIVSLC